MTALAACGHPSTEAETLFDARDPATGDAFLIVRCRRCHLAQTAPAPSDAELDRYYPQGYHSTTRRYRGGMDRVLSMVHRSRIRTIERLLGGTGSVLDIGCGPGVLINQMRSAGLAGSRHRTIRLGGAAGARRIPPRRQRGGRRRAGGGRRHLRRGGPLARRRAPPCPGRDRARHRSPAASRRGPASSPCPNFASPEARIGRAGWFHLDVPRHLVHLTPSTLRAILGSAGFRPVKVTHLVPEYDLFSFVQTAENRLGLPRTCSTTCCADPRLGCGGSRASRVPAGVAVGLAVAAQHCRGRHRAARAARGAARRSPCMRCGFPLSASSGASGARGGAARSDSTRPHRSSARRSARRGSSTDDASSKYLRCDRNLGDLELERRGLGEDLRVEDEIVRVAQERHGGEELAAVCAVAGVILGEARVPSTRFS